MNAQVKDLELPISMNSQPTSGLALLGVVCSGTVLVWVSDSFLGQGSLGIWVQSIVFVAMIAALAFAQKRAKDRGLVRSSKAVTRFRTLAPLVLWGLAVIAVVLKIALHSNAPLEILALIDVGFFFGALPSYLGSPTQAPDYGEADETN